MEGGRAASGAGGAGAHAKQRERERGSATIPAETRGGRTVRSAPAHPVAYFTRRTLLAVSAWLRGARACKSNARCPLVNLRINTHRGDNLRSRTSWIFLSLFVSPSPSLCLVSFLFQSVPLCFRTRFYPPLPRWRALDSVFGSTEWDLDCPGRRARALVKTPRYAVVLTIVTPRRR